MPGSVRTTRLTSVPKETPVAEILTHVARDGGVIVERLFSSHQVKRLNEEIDPHLAAMHVGGHPDASKKDGVRVGTDEGFPDFYGGRTKRLTKLISLSETFREECIVDDTLLSLVDGMLLPSADSYWLTTAQVIEIHPGQGAQVLHRDMENYPVFRSMGPAGPEVQINMMVALTEFSEEMGATRVIPASHLWEDFEERGVAEMTIAAEMQPGSGLLISGKVIHGGGANTTLNQTRRGLSFSFNAGYLVPSEAHPFIVPLDFARSLPPKVQMMLGFRTFHNARQRGGSLWQVDYEDLELFLRRETETRAVNDEFSYGRLERG